MQLIHSDTDQRSDVFTFMFSASLEKASIGDQCL
jgi:hypothetical protein